MTIRHINSDSKTGMKKILFFPLIIIFSFTATLTHAQDKELYLSVEEALLSGGLLSGESGPASVNWIDNGERYSYMARNAETQNMEIRVYDPSTQDDSLIFDTANVTFPGTDTPFAYRSFQWSDDSKYLVFQTKFSPIYRYSGTADYYYYSVEDETLQLLVEGAFTAKLSPDGQKLGYHKDGNMYVYELSTGTETQLTFGETEDVFYGRFGWVYEEEFGLVQAWEWSHDSSYIAFWKSDEREVPLFSTTDYEGIHPEWFEIPFPKAGDTNPIVEIGVADVQSAELTWMELDLNDGYVPRIYWTSETNQLAVTHFNRNQTHLKLLFYDVKTGSGRLIMEEQADRWFDVFDFFAGIDHYLFFPDSLDQFFWVSDRDGWKHMYRYDYNGNLINQVTSGEWQVEYVHAVDADNEEIFYTSTEVSQLDRQLYRISFDGSDKKRITTEPGRHRINMSTNARYFLDTYSNTATPRQVELWDTNVGMLEKLVDNKGVLEFFREHAYSPREIFQFTTTDGQQLEGSIILPYNFDENQSYPLVVSIYGGPTAQGVYNEFETNAFNQYLSQQGYIIANVNNRGSGGYGRDFEKIVYKNLGQWEAHDFAETARYLAETHSWVDGNRMAIRGHSYGGYMSALTMMLHPDVFKLGIVGAPVTDWRLYDTIYTERYMGLPSENKEGYDAASVLTHVKNLKGRLLIAHSAMDENVHLQNTMQLITALTDAGKDADLRIYPKGNHGVAYNLPSYILLHETYFEFLERYVKNARP